MDFSASYNGVRKTLSTPRYLLLGLITSSLTLTLISVWENLPLMEALLTSSGLSLVDRIAIFLNQFPFINTVTPLYYDIGLVLVSLGIGLNIALFVNQYYSGRLQLRNSAASGIGTGVAVFGAGCAACGAALLGSLLSLIGGASLLLLLPYGGAELLWIAALLLIWAAYMNSRELGTPQTCEIPSPDD